MPNIMTPQKLPIQVIGPSVLKRLRSEYAEMWSRPWPEDDSYLALLVVQAKDSLGMTPSSKAKRDEVREFVLDEMRACHEFVPLP